ncbi:VPLPA-CTERM-specific exosortase XrtD [Methylotenera versatilis]|uniref:VPLPA-CTERM-specific exosortase XrtD n=1 Tax=Methylotenera versatilis TaxID=1055487 RepID=UPI001362CDA4|nr:VPLPA-CTERM-specific exosortase XrtD [Methylotenera versatilis]
MSLTQNQKWFLFALVLAFVAYFGGLSDLVSRWNTQEEYGHGYFIPLISIWFLWARKEALLASIGESSWVGPVLIAIGAVGLLLGELTAIFVLIQLSFLLTLIGLVLAYGGKSLLRVSLLPIAFLAFAIPLPYFLGAQLSWRLQLISSDLGVAFLRILGNSVYLEGNVIDLGIYKLQVVEACSGLRYLYPLLSIGFLMAYMYKGKLWQKIFIFLSTIPITVIMNSLRIAMVGVLVNRWGNDMADGFLHYFEGWIIFMVCLLILILEVVILEKIGQKRHFWQAVDVPVIQPVHPDKPESIVKKPLYVSIVLILVALIAVNLLSDRVEIKPERKPLATFPTKIDNWIAKESSLPKDVEEFLGVDDYLLADYKTGRDSVNFYVAYYASQRKGVSPHSPQVCMPGGGWIISSLDRITIDVAGKKDFHVNRTVINKDNHRQVVYYWFEQRGRHIANEYYMKWYLLLDSIQRNRTDGALVRVTAYIRPSESIEAADKRIQAFLEKSIPLLDTYVPK